MKEDHGPSPRVVRTRFPFDADSPLAAYGDRCLAIFDRNDGRAYFIGPTVTVACDSPTPAFWRAVYAEVGSWRGESRQYFGRRLVDHGDEWLDPAHPNADSEHHHFHRIACVTGLLLLGREQLSPSQWPNRQEVGYRPRRRGGRRVKNRQR